MTVKLIRLLGLAAVLLLTLGSGLFGQTLKPGTWSGAVTDPEGEEAAVTYEVTLSGDTIGINMTVVIPDAPPPFVFSNVHFDQGKLLFTWVAGVDINCTLDPAADGSYAGTCTDTEGKSGRMTMSPPKDG